MKQRTTGWDQQRYNQGTTLVFFGGSEENHENPVVMAGIQAEIETQHLSNTIQKHYPYANLSGGKDKYNSHTNT